MLVYDITNEKSFENIKNWIRNIEEVCGATNVTFFTCLLQYIISFCLSPQHLIFSFISI